jgi:hypothetical protein
LQRVYRIWNERVREFPTTDWMPHMGTCNTFWLSTLEW